MGVSLKSNRMPYDHARKAGNRGDVWKHFTLVSVIDSLDVPERFRYVDLHSGAPIHDLRPGGEWKSGIGTILTECRALTRHGYFETASAFLGKMKYPAAWWFAGTRLAGGVSTWTWF